jgi:hypothetical protein
LTLSKHWDINSNNTVIINAKLITDNLEKTWRRPDITKVDLKEDEC